MNLPVVESCPISDVFCEELVDIERLGPCVRLTFAVQSKVTFDEPPAVRAVVAKLILPAAALAEIAAALLAGKIEAKTAPALRGELP
jgi:hypothetical protein